jgi:hypothetical protein
VDDAEEEGTAHDYDETASTSEVRGSKSTRKVLESRSEAELRATRTPTGSSGKAYAFSDAAKGSASKGASAVLSGGKVVVVFGH